MTSVNQQYSKWLPMAWKHYFTSLKNLKVPFSQFWEHHFQLPKRYLFRNFENITSNCQKGTFLHFWEHRFQLQKKYLFVPFMRSLETAKKKYLFCALKHRLVKWKMDEEQTILTSKYHSIESWKYLTSFSKQGTFS